MRQCANAPIGALHGAEYLAPSARGRTIFNCAYHTGFISLRSQIPPRSFPRPGGEPDSALAFADSFGIAQSRAGRDFEGLNLALPLRLPKERHCSH